MVNSMNTSSFPLHVDEEEISKKAKVYLDLLEPVSYCWYLLYRVPNVLMSPIHELVNGSTEVKINKAVTGDVIIWETKVRPKKYDIREYVIDTADEMWQRRLFKNLNEKNYWINKNIKRLK